MLDMFKGFQRVLSKDTSTLACVPNPKSTTWHFLIWDQGEKVSLDCFGPCSLGFRDAVLPKSPPKFEPQIFVIALDTQLWRGKGPSVSNPPQIFLAKAAPWKCLVFHIGGPEKFKFQKKQLPQQSANLTTSPHFFEGSEKRTWLEHVRPKINKKSKVEWANVESPQNMNGNFHVEELPYKSLMSWSTLTGNFSTLTQFHSRSSAKKKPYTGPGGVL